MTRFTLKVVSKVHIETVVSYVFKQRQSVLVYLIFR